MTISSLGWERCRIGRNLLHTGKRTWMVSYDQGALTRGRAHSDAHVIRQMYSGSSVRRQPHSYGSKSTYKGLEIE
jgi:hypothetical protein